MFAKLMAAREKEEGFTLIELLVVIIIIGILAAIAIPVFLNQRQKAWDSAATSDLRNAAMAEETYFTEKATYAPDVAALAGSGFTQSDGVTVSVESGTATAFCVEALSKSGKTFNIKNGGAVAEGACA